MPEMTILIDTQSGDLLMEGPSLPSLEGLTLVHRFLGPAGELGCARPRTLLPPPAPPEADSAQPTVRIAGYYHNSLVEGPGRRSSALFTGCTLACPQCWVPTLHPMESGTPVGVETLARALLDPAFERDGVSVLGGEPMQQPEGLWALVQALRAQGCRHILVYSGYTYEHLHRLALRQPAIGAVLDEVEMLIDGRFVAARADGAGRWTGSGNQRVIDLVATRRSGRVVCWDETVPEGQSQTVPRPE